MAEGSVGKSVKGNDDGVEATGLTKGAPEGTLDGTRTRLLYRRKDGGADGWQRKRRGGGTEKTGGGCSCCCCCPYRQLSHLFGGYYHVSFALHRSRLISDTESLPVSSSPSSPLMLSQASREFFICRRGRRHLGPSRYKMCGKSKESRRTRQQPHCCLDVFCIQYLFFVATRGVQFSKVFQILTLDICVSHRLSSSPQVLFVAQYSTDSESIPFPDQHLCVTVPHSWHWSLGRCTP